MTQAQDVQLAEVTKQGDVSWMMQLVAAGARVNSDVEHSALVWAANEGHLDAARWLLDNGSDVESKSPDKWTPLMSAASKGHSLIAQLLVDHGANPHRKYTDGKTAIDKARENQHSDLANALLNTPDEVSYFDTVSDRVVHEVYSFKRRERFTFIRKSQNDDVEAMQRESFHALDDKSGLRRAFDEHRKRGGMLSEEEVFGDTLVKPRKTLPSPGGTP
ncbi:MAG: ankyrin repeat domain-containing protein [bacterium]|nr:ankyrin repeat domain-containing protein [bacterium]